MPEGTTKNTLAIIAIVGMLALEVVCITFAGGDSLIQGIGNSSNRIYANGIADEVAEAIAASSVVPEVPDDELRATYLAIRDRARSGDLEAAMVVLRVAEIQRAEGRR